DLVQGALVFGFKDAAAIRGTDLALEPAAAHFRVDGVRFTLPVPGAHNVENALGAIAVCRALGLRLTEMAEPLSRFRGVARRFQPRGGGRGGEVGAASAHTPAKIAASPAPAPLRAGRVLAVYHPHGYGPPRFPRDGFVATFATA